MKYVYVCCIVLYQSIYYLFKNIRKCTLKYIQTALFRCSLLLITSGKHVHESIPPHTPLLYSE